MTEDTANGNSKLKWILGGTVGGLLSIGVVGFLIFSAVCPASARQGDSCLEKLQMGQLTTGLSPMMCLCANYKFMLASDLIPSI